MRLVTVKIVNVFERPSLVQGRGGQEEQEEAGGGCKSTGTTSKTDQCCIFSERYSR